MSSSEGAGAYWGVCRLARPRRRRHAQFALLVPTVAAPPCTSALAAGAQAIRVWSACWAIHLERKRSIILTSTCVLKSPGSWG